MPVQLQPGARLVGAACSVELIVVRAPAEPVDIRIGGHPARTLTAERDHDLGVLTDEGSGPLIGKRYVDQAGTIEVLCTKAGAGAIAVGRELLVVKDSQPLPSSD